MVSLAAVVETIEEREREEAGFPPIPLSAKMAAGSMVGAFGFVMQIGVALIETGWSMVKFAAKLTGAAFLLWLGWGLITGEPQRITMNERSQLAEGSEAEAC